MPPLIECVPNFSEARRPEVVEAIAAAIRNTSGVQLLNVSSDHDHNRTVITFVGAPDGVEAAAFNAIAKAAELIDLDRHTGEHPRLGATDVVPFIPIREATMADCVAIARRLGERVGRELNIPVYLYEAAATRPDRENLENIRRGQYEGLKTEIETNPDRKPDFGPAKLGKAGATVIGARQFLIAYNVYLNTANVEIAKKIAKAIRHSSGGLRYVKGLGLLVEGRAQVSMNLTDFTKTPLYRVQEMIRREAERYGCAITHSELVGMIPQQALVDAAQWYLQLDNLEPEMILENKIAAVQEGGGKGQEAISRYQFIADLAAGTPTPGGGAAAAFTGALAAGLAAMVARLTLGKKKYSEVEAEMQSVVERAERLRAELTSAVSEDSVSFDALRAAMKLPKDSDEQKAKRDEAVQQARRGATEVPLRVARACGEVITLAGIVAEKGNLNAASDAGSSANLALAALRAAVMNVRANAPGLADKALASRWLKEAADLEARAQERVEAINRLIPQRAGWSA